MSGSTGPAIAPPWDGIPDGVFVVTDFGPAVVVSYHIAVWGRDNSYRNKLSRPHSGAASVISPPSTVSILHAGYPVHIDDAAR